MAFTRDEIQFMASKGWDIQPDGVTFRNRSPTTVVWIEHGPFGWRTLEVLGDGSEKLGSTFDSPIAIVVSLEIDRSNNQ
jgi:hypothetical protein